MTFVRTVFSMATFAVATLATPAWAAAEVKGNSHQPPSAAAVQLAQAKPATPASGMGGMGSMMGNTGAAGMPGMEAQLKAMRDMHDKMVAAKTPAERNALMAEHMKIMQNGMNMMGGMGPAAMMGSPGDVAARQRMMEQRMDMMQSMMQMMVDRVQPVPATK